MSILSQSCVNLCVIVCVLRLGGQVQSVVKCGESGNAFWFKLDKNLTKINQNFLGMPVNVVPEN